MDRAISGVLAWRRSGWPRIKRDGEIAWDAGLEIRLERPVRVIGRANPARRKVKPAHPAGSKKACREQAQLPAP